MPLPPQESVLSLTAVSRYRLRGLRASSRAADRLLIRATAAAPSRMEITRLATECGSISGLISPADWPSSTILAKKSSHVLDMLPRHRLFVQVRFRGYSSIATIGLRPLILTGS